MGGAHHGGDEDEDWFGTDLDPLVQDNDPEELAAPQSKASGESRSPAKTPRPSALSGPVTSVKNETKASIKAENGGENDEDEGHHCCDYTNTSSDSSAQHNIVDFLDGDDTSWLDFDRSPLISPSMPLQKLSARDTKLLLLSGTTSPAVKIEEQFLLPDETDYSLPEFTDDEVSALVGSPSASSSTPSYLRDAMPHTNLISPTPQSVGGGDTVSTQCGHQTSSSHGGNSINVSEKDIPDMVNLFSSMYSPSETAHHRKSSTTSSSLSQSYPQPAPTPTHPNSLSILVPAPHMYATMFPFSTTAAGAASFAAAAAVNASVAAAPASSSSGGGVNQFDYFTPPGFTNNRYLMDGSQLNSALFLSADTLSPSTKGGGPSMYSNAANAAVAQSRAFAQVHAQAHAVAAAAVAMANSAAAINTMRKLNTTYGVPIAPLQRCLHPELKPKLPTSSITTSNSLGAKTLLAAATTSNSSTSSSKVTKISITPDISDFKLVQIYHNFCDPASKVITLTRFQQLLHHHQVKDNPNALSSSKTSNNSTASGNTSNSISSKVVLVSQETQSLFKVLDPKTTGYIDLERFMSSFQICNRCTEAKRRAHSAQCASQGQSFVSTALERQLMEDVAPVIVRVVPTSYEGSKVKSCEHYQWTWCEGFAKTGNEKCRGTNRHDKCPKYLANCTLWKHKLPPKNRKAKVLENQESPSKKFKHFA